MRDPELSAFFPSALVEFSTSLSQSGLAIYSDGYNMEAFGSWTIGLGMRKIKMIIVSSLALLTLAACASDFAIYEAPTTGRVSTIKFVNASENHRATLVTFDDGINCTGRRPIQFENEYAIPAGSSRSLSFAAGREFALFATLNRIEDEEYAVELGVTGSGPAPVVSRRFTAIGCDARLSFPIEPANNYQVVISGPESSGSCSVVVSEIHAEGMVAPVETSERIARSSWDKTRSYCEPLAK